MKHGIVFDWTEKNREQAMSSWGAYGVLDDKKKREIALEILETIKEPLQAAIRTALDENIPREISAISVVVRNTLGETFSHNFESIEDAIMFLNAFDEDRDMNTDDAENLLFKLNEDQPPLFE